MSEIEQRIVELIRQGRSEVSPNGYARSYFMAPLLGLTTAQVHRRLVAMEKRGVVERDPRYSAVNCLAWSLPDER